MDSERPSTSNSSRPVSRGRPASPFRMSLRVVPPSPKSATIMDREDLRMSPMRAAFLPAAASAAQADAHMPYLPHSLPHSVPSEASSPSSAAAATVDGPSAAGTSMDIDLAVSTMGTSVAGSSSSRACHPALTPEPEAGSGEMTGEVLVPRPIASTPSSPFILNSDHTSHTLPHPSHASHPLPSHPILPNHTWAFGIDNVPFASVSVEAGHRRESSTPNPQPSHSASVLSPLHIQRSLIEARVAPTVDESTHHPVSITAPAGPALPLTPTTLGHLGTTLAPYPTAGTSSSTPSSCPVLLASSADVSRPLLTNEPLNRSTVSASATAPFVPAFSPAPVPAPVFLPESVSLPIPSINNVALPAFISHATHPAAPAVYGASFAYPAPPPPHLLASASPARSDQSGSRPAKRRRANSLPSLEPDYKRPRSSAPTAGGRSAHFRSHSPSRPPLPSESYSRSLRLPHPPFNRLEHQRQRAAVLWQRLLDFRNAEMRKYVRSVRLTAPLDLPAEAGVGVETVSSASAMAAFGILPFAPEHACGLGLGTQAMGRKHGRKTLRELLAQPHLLPRLAHHLSLAFEHGTAASGPEHDLYWEAVAAELETGCRCTEWEGRYDARAGYTFDSVVRRRVRRSECACAGWQEGEMGSRIPSMISELRTRILALLGPETSHHLSLPFNLAETIDPYLPQVQEAFRLLEPDLLFSLAESGRLRAEPEHSDHLGRIMSFLVLSLGAEVERLIGLHAIRRAAEDGKWGKAFRRSFALVRKLEMDQFMRTLLEPKRLEIIARRLERHRTYGPNAAADARETARQQMYEASKRVLLDTPVSERSRLFSSALPGSAVRVPSKAYALKAFTELVTCAASSSVAAAPFALEDDERLVRLQGTLFRMQRKAAMLQLVHREVAQSASATTKDAGWLEQAVHSVLDRPGLLEHAAGEVAMLVTLHLRPFADSLATRPLSSAELAATRTLESRLRDCLAHSASTAPRLQKALGMLVVDELADLLPSAPASGYSTPVPHAAGGGHCTASPVCPASNSGSSPGSGSGSCCANTAHFPSSTSGSGPTPSSSAGSGNAPRCVSPAPLARSALEPGVIFRPHSLVGTLPVPLETAYARVKRMLRADGVAGLTPELEGVAEHVAGMVRYVYGVWGKEFRYGRVMAGATAARSLGVST